MSDQSTEQVREEQPTQRTRTFNPNEHVMQLKSREGSKDYLPVQWRLVWFREQCPHGTIKTEMLHLDLDRETEEEAYVWNNEKRRSEKVVKQAKGYVVFRALVEDGKGGIATGTKSEKAASFGDFIEKAETGAIGRALAALGYGTQFAPELNEEHRIVDSPVERQPMSANNGYSSGNTPAANVRPLATASNGNSTHGYTTSAGQAQRVAESANGNGYTTQPMQTPRVAESAGEELATEQQVSSIRKLCEHLGKAEPENVAAISYLSAKKLIQQLTAEYKESRQSKKAS